MKKRFLSILLALCMVVTLLPGTAWAADSDFTIENGVLTKYNGSGGDVTIPSGVTSIGDQAFWACRNLTSVTIPSSVTSIGSRAFGFAGLTSVTIPSSVTHIYSEAFLNCSALTSVTLPSGITEIGYGVFDGCTSLTSVNIPFGVTEISGHIFSNCSSLTDVTIPSSVESIGSYAFYNCSGLVSVNIPSSVTNVGSRAFWKCGSLANINIPSSVTSIGEGAFFDTPWLKNQGEFAIVNGILLAYNGSGKSIAIPSGVREIGGNAFYGCTTLTDVNIPSSVTSIGAYAFQSCSNLTNVSIPSGVTEIGRDTFYFCTSLSSVSIPSSVTSIGWQAFDGCTNLTDVYFGGSEAQWKAIDITAKNFENDRDTSIYLISANIHYNSIAPGISTVGGFSDVSSDAYYADAVRWAVSKNITTGTTSTSFSPNTSCTQAQILTFLYRTVGEPAVLETNSYTYNMVAPDKYYYNAMLWAYQNGVVTDAGLNPDSDCARKDVVTYLWRLKGESVVSGGNFTDVPASADYAQAVAWAVQQNITTGTSDTTFSPDDACTRAQIVTFLYRALAD